MSSILNHQLLLVTKTSILLIPAAPMLLLSLLGIVALAVFALQGGKIKGG